MRRFSGWLLLLGLSAGDALAQSTAHTASYAVKVLSPTRVAVRATLSGRGSLLAMSRSRPGDVQEVAAAGWPGLVKNLVVTEAAGETVGTTSAGAAGWTLARPGAGPVTLDYEVEYAPLAARGWPAPRECAFGDADHLVVIGRSLFITTPNQGASEVRFSLPSGWTAVTAWDASAPSTDDLTENLIVLMRGSPEVLKAGGFRMKVVPIGHWQTARHEVRRALGGVVKRLVAFVGSDDRSDYLVVLLPQNEDGGESFRASFAMTARDTPSKSNVGAWANTIAHEAFHRWNGWILRGADYASSQWFQEGFTEYAANLALVSAGITTPAQFFAELAAHVNDYRRLATPLDAPGTHKGPPLYGGGALVAFTWDTMIRESTRSARGVGDVMRALLKNSEGGKRPYVWADIQAALESVAPGPWGEFHRRYIQGSEQLPLADAFGRVGLRLAGGDGATVVEPDPAANETARARRRALMGK
jgi:predicted metalloprotease with PDZ domain